MPSDELPYRDKIAKATLMLLLEQRSEEQQRELRAELLLERAGFTFTETADLLGKQPSAVRMAISRARKSDRG